MPRTHLTFTLAAVVLTTAAGHCGPLPFSRPRPLVERRNATISPSRFHVLGTIAGGGSRTDLQISVTVRQQLTDSGFNVVRRKGRWESQSSAVRNVCGSAEAPRLDGVLFVWYNRLELYDCATELAAYEIGGGSLGINQMADRLVAYLRRDTPAPPAQQ